MRKLITKAIISGFILGSIFFVIAPLGLGSSLIENLRPALIPGALLMQLFGQGDVDLTYMLSSLFLNGLIYSILIFIITLVRSKFL